MSRTKTISALLLLVGAAGLRAQEGAACRPSFLAATGDAMPEFPATLDTSDVNLDGYPDLLVTAFDSQAAIAVRLGLPDGSFGSPIHTSGSVDPYYATVGAFDAGPTPDVVTGGFGGPQFFSGNGDGTFDPGVALPDAGPLSMLRSADLNGDGDLDFVGVTFFQPPPVQVRVYLGNGNGTFAAPLDLSPVAPLVSLAIGEVTGDDHPDLVAPDGSNTVWIYPGLGDGTFGPPSSVIAGAGLGAILLQDVNGDGGLDMILASSTFVAVLFGNGDGTFQAARNYATPIRPTWLATGDFDGDAETDIVATTNSPYPSDLDGAVTLLQNVGDGSFVVGPTVVAGRGPAALRAADFGNDGRLDFAVVSPSDSVVNVVYGNGDGTFQAVRLSVFVPAAPYSPAAKGDFDEDGRLDLAASYGGGFGVLRAIGGGAFAQGPVYPTNGLGPYSMVAGYFDGDAHLDVATVSSYTLDFALGNGDGTFQEPSSIDLPVYSSSLGLTSGDFDGNGIADLAVAGWDFPNPSEGVLWVYLGNGDGTFAPPIAAPLPETEFGYAIVAGRFDGDLLDDLAVRTSGGAPVATVFLSNGDGTFDGSTPSALPPNSTDIAAADMRQSGHLDLLFGGDGVITILPGNGDGTFGAPDSIVTGSYAVALDTADFDGDGNADVITANYQFAGASSATVLFGTGGGEFATPRTYKPGTSSSVNAGDFDGNGRPDGAFIATSDMSGVSVLLNADLAARVPNRSVVVGEAAMLVVRAAGFGPLSYQWRRDGAPIPGATGPTLTIDPVAFTDAGSYDVVVTDDCGSVNSEAGLLSVEFADVAVSSPFHGDILDIATAGIAAGCGSGNYCPTSPVRRDQMAVFLLKSEHGADYTPPGCTGAFDDVPCPGPFTDWVEQLAAEGVTGGCGTDVYCPDQSVTRAQMAVFLLKTKEGSGYVPPAATGIFGDVPVGSFGADFIEDLYSRSITGGCSVSPLLYCPGNAVLRQQMATFLVRTFFP